MRCPSEGGDLQGMFTVLSAFFRLECFASYFAVFGFLALRLAVSAFGLPPRLVAGIPPFDFFSRPGLPSSSRRVAAHPAPLLGGGVDSRESPDPLDPVLSSSLFTESDSLPVDPSLREGGPDSELPPAVLMLAAGQSCRRVAARVGW